MLFQVLVRPVLKLLIRPQKILSVLMGFGGLTALTIRQMVVVMILVVNKLGLDFPSPLLLYTMMSNLCLSIIIFISFSCTKQKDDVSFYHTVKIDLQINQKGNFSKFIKRLDYNLIKTISPNYLVSPYKIIANDSIYLIEDSFQKKVLNYNEFSGVFNFIGKNGEGPSENLELDDFSLENSRVVFHDSKLKKFLSFNLNGDYLDEQKTTYERLIFFQGNGFKLVYTHSDPQIGFRILRIDDSGKVKGFINVEEWFAFKLTRDQNGFIYSPKLNKIFILLPYTNEIAIFDGNGELSRLIKIDFGKYAFTKENWERFTEFNSQIKYATENKLVFQINSFLVLDKYFVVSANQEGGDSHIIVFDHDFNILNRFTDLKNDIDNVKISGIPWSAYKNKFLFMVNSKRFFNDNKHLFEENSNVPNSNINQFMKLYGEDLFQDEYQVIVEVDLK